MARRSASATKGCGICRAKRSGWSASGACSGEQKYYLANLPTDADLRTLAATTKARWVCEQAHRQLKEELGLDHFEGRSMARPASSRADDNDRPRFPPASQFRRRVRRKESPSAPLSQRFSLSEGLSSSPGRALRSYDARIAEERSLAPSSEFAKVVLSCGCAADDVRGQSSHPLASSPLGRGKQWKNQREFRIRQIA